MTPDFPIRLVQDGLLASAWRSPAKVALVSGVERWTYTDLLEAAQGAAQGFMEAGLEPGDRVAVFMENRAEAAVAIYGTWLAGGTVVVVSPQTRADRLGRLLGDCGPRLLVTQDSLKRVWGRAGFGGSTFCMDGTPGEVRSFEAAMMLPGCEGPTGVATDLAALVYTSGSTGDDKGVMLTHQNMTFTLGSLVEYLRLRPEDRILGLLPLAFDYGLYQLLMAVHLGATLVLESGFSYPLQVAERILSEAITVFPGVPTVFSTFLGLRLERPLVFPSVRCVTNTAAALSPDLLPSLARMFPSADLFLMYGLTECKRVCYLEPEEVPHRPGSVGKAIPGTEVFLLDPEGRRVGPGGCGILHVRGPHVMVGYWGKPEHTAHMLRPGRHPGDRVLCTHDVFRMDAEGFLYFEGRTDDIIKSRGEKVSPVEVEHVLHAMPGVRDAAVIGVPDPVLGEGVVAFVSADPGVVLDPREIRRFCLARLEPFKVPGEVHVLEELPRTDTGKVRKKGLASLLPQPAHP